MGKAVKLQVHGAGLPAETPVLSTNPGQEKLWEAAFPQGAALRIHGSADASPAPGAGRSWEGTAGSKVP